ncbi:MAG: TrmH family RNA methyltransferase [Gemmatimonadales bacterium]
MNQSDLVVRFTAARTDPSLAVLEGLHALKHAIRFGAAIVDVVTPDAAILETLARRLAPDVAAAIEAAATEVAPELFRHLTAHPIETGVAAIAKRPAIDERIFASLDDTAPVVLLEDPAHSGNVGAVVRVAAAAGAAAVVTTGMHDPWNPGALRGSAGLHFALPVLRIAAPVVPGRPLVAIDPDGDEVLSPDIALNAVLAFGSERRGLTDALVRRADARVRIPMRPGVSSLNLATAVAVMLYTMRRAR